MRIYFYDGVCDPNNVDFKYDFIVDAKFGYKNNVETLNLIKQFEIISKTNPEVCTNSIVALNNEYAWNDELNVPEIYLLRGDQFIRIDELTKRKLRNAHNMMKMYMAGEFD